MVGSGKLESLPGVSDGRYMALGSGVRILNSSCSKFYLSPPMLLTPIFKTFELQNVFIEWAPVYHSECSLDPVSKCEHCYLSTCVLEGKADGTRDCKLGLCISTSW